MLTTESKNQNFTISIIKIKHRFLLNFIINRLVVLVQLILTLDKNLNQSIRCKREIMPTLILSQNIFNSRVSSVNT